jgi:hypothetical protein
MYFVHNFTEGLGCLTCKKAFSNTRMAQAHVEATVGDAPRVSILLEKETVEEALIYAKKFPRL